MNELTKAGELKRGWWLLPVCLLGTMTSVIALPFYMIGPVLPMLERSFGWDRTAIVAATSFLQIGLVFGMPLAGKAIDRFGGRMTALWSYVLAVAVLAGIALQLQSLTMLRIGYLALGLLCAGASTVPFTLLIGKWFDKARGLALGVALAGTGLASFMAPNLIEGVGTAFGWRTAILAVAGVIALGIPITLFGYREPPAEKATAATTAQSAQDERQWKAATWRNLIQEPRFLLMVAQLMMAGAFISSMVVHFVPLLIDQGLSTGQAARIASINGIAMIVGRLVIGWLLDRYPAVWLGTAMFLIAAAGCLAFVFGGVGYAPVMVIGMGFMIGAEIDLLSYLVLRYFRLGDYGIVYGYIYGLYMAGCIASPWVVAALIGAGGYMLMFLAAAVTFVFVAALFPLLEHLPAGPAAGLAKTAQS